MKKYEKVKENKYFNKIIEEGRRIKTPYFIIFYLEKNEFKPKFGVAVGKKVGNAVVRNNLKRKTLKIIDNHKNLFKNNRDYIIISKEECLKSSYDSLNNEFENILKEKIK